MNAFTSEVDAKSRLGDANPTNSDWSAFFYCSVRQRAGFAARPPGWSDRATEDVVG